MTIYAISKGERIEEFGPSVQGAADIYDSLVLAAAGLDTPIPADGLFSAQEIHWATTQARLGAEVVELVDARLDEIAWNPAEDRFLAQGPARLVLETLNRMALRGSLVLVRSVASIEIPTIIA